MVEKVKGVDGWLLVFIVFLVIVLPLFLLAVWAVNGLPFFDDDSYSNHLSSFFDLGVVLWGLFIGVSLWKTKSKAVIRAKEFLVAVLTLNIFFLINWLFASSLAPKWIGIYLFVFPNLFYDVFRGIVFPIAGLLYLTNSVRVKNTYKYRKLNWKRVVIISIVVFVLAFILVDILIPVYSPFSR